MSDPDAVLTAIEHRFGTIEGMATPSWPLFMGGSEASVAMCRVSRNVLASVTTDVRSGDPASMAYELVMFESPATRPAGPALMTRIGGAAAASTPLGPGHTLEVPRSETPRRSRIRGLMFLDFGVLEADGGVPLLLAFGLTLDEFDAARLGAAERLEQGLRAISTFPVTDWRRRSSHQ